ncbi:AN1-type zinc finger protein 4 [Helicoverpa armigera]|uniref:AN1-type zinc finger protein 4 n=1 Tax=Helicoverpa armigera TaxID=29058 RepID=UPI0030835AF4
MSQHGCPERLSNRSKGFQDDGPSQSTMEVLVETLTGTAFEMTVLPTDTIFAIKSKIFRVEGIPVSQQHLLYNLKELEDSSSLREHAIGDGARLRLVLGMRGGPISMRRLPPPPSAEPWRDIERLLDTNRDDVEWGGSGCKVTVLVFRDGERVNMLRVQENRDGTYSPLDHNKYSSTSSSLPQLSCEGGSLHDNAVTMGKMLDLRRRMESLSVQRHAPTHHHHRTDKVEIQKTRSEESLSVPSAEQPATSRLAALCVLPDCHADCHADPLLRDDCHADQLLRDDEEAQITKNLQPIQAEYGPLVLGAGGGWVAAHSQSASSLVRAAPRRPAPLADALFSSSTSDLENLKRNSRILPALSRHRPREHLHLSDERLDAAPAAPPAPAPAAPAAATPAPPAGRRTRCGLCRKRLSIATLHRCRCGGSYCAPHRYAEVHGCAYDYRADVPRPLPLHAPKLPRI